jgi:hypothetical protein
MTPDQKIVLYVIVGLVAFGFFYRRREALAHAIRGTIKAFICFGIAFVLLWKGGLPPLGAYIVALIIGVLIRRAEPRRSRYISARAKRQAIAKWEKETGETFNRGIHELDHVLPHSRGGGNSEDNIQVLTRKQNRSKGARRRLRDEDS